MEEKIDDIEVEINQNIISNGKKIKKKTKFLMAIILTY